MSTNEDRAPLGAAPDAAFPATDTASAKDAAATQHGTEPAPDTKSADPHDALSPAVRRLVRQYDRSAESVFPTGAFVKGSDYGTDVSFPVPQSEENNPNYQAAACVTTRA